MMTGRPLRSRFSTTFHISIPSGKIFVRSAIDELPPQQRIAILLKYYSGLTHEEISEILDIVPSSTAELISKAYNKLQQKLKFFLN